MNRKFMNQPLARPLTPREKGIRTKYGALFVLAALTALITGVYCNRLDTENTELKRNQAQFDSLYSKMDYIPDSTMEDS
jgi:type II secretory pathway component PulM